MKLTEKGKATYTKLIIMAIGCMVLSGFLIFYWKAVQLFWVCLLPLFYYLHLRNNLHKRLEDTVLRHFGFQPISNTKKNRFGVEFSWDKTDNLLANYKIGAVSTCRVITAYDGHIENEPVRLIEFSASVGSGKHKETHKYMGLEFTTIKENLPVQITDSANDFKRLFKRPIELESNEFNKIFRVTGENAKNAFYQLDPDTMHDLIEKRKELNAQINMDMAGAKILVYTNQETYLLLIKNVLSFEDVLNGDIVADDLASYHESIPKFLGTFRKVFKLLDYQSQKVTQQ